MTALHACRSSGATTYRTGTTTRSTTRSVAWSPSWCLWSSAWIPRTLSASSSQTRPWTSELHLLALDGNFPGCTIARSLAQHAWGLHPHAITLPGRLSGCWRDLRSPMQLSRLQVWACKCLTASCRAQAAWVRRLYAMGVITTKKSLVQLEKLSTSAFCRRRLSVVMVRLKMAETLKEACTLIEQVRSLSWWQVSATHRRALHPGKQPSAWICRVCQTPDTDLLPCCAQHLGWEAHAVLKYSWLFWNEPLNLAHAMLHALAYGMGVKTILKSASHQKLPFGRSRSLHAGPCESGSRGGAEPGIPRDSPHGGLCDLGGHLQDPAQGAGLQWQAGRFRPPQLSRVCRCTPAAHKSVLCESVRQLQHVPVACRGERWEELRCWGACTCGGLRISNALDAADILQYVTRTSQRLQHRFEAGTPLLWQRTVLCKSERHVNHWTAAEGSLNFPATGNLRGFATRTRCHDSAAALSHSVIPFSSDSITDRQTQIRLCHQEIADEIVSSRELLVLFWVYISGGFCEPASCGTSQRRGWPWQRRWWTRWGAARPSQRLGWPCPATHSPSLCTLSLWRPAQHSRSSCLPDSRSLMQEPKMAHAASTRAAASAVRISYSACARVRVSDLSPGTTKSEQIWMPG